MKYSKQQAANLMSSLEQRSKEMKAFLNELVGMETPSHDPKAQLAILNFLSDKLRSMGFYTLHVPGKHTGGYLFARPADRDRSKPMQLMVGHCDTVWAHHTLEEMPIERKGAMMKGPGIYDMKAGITQMIFALEACMELGESLPLCPLILINSDEEIGSRESTPAIRRLARIVERVFVLEPPLGLDGKIKTARKGIGRFTVEVKGRAAHAGLDPTKGINAIVELSHQVQSLYAMNDLDKGITVNVGMIEGGISPNVIAPRSKAVVDVRVANNSDGEAITDKILSLKPVLPDVELKIDGGIGRPPMERTPANRALWKLVREAGLLIDMDLEQAAAGGGSDANTTSLYTATVDGLGTPGDGAHATHEYILHEQLPKRTTLLALLLLSETNAAES